jgi:hypothetical protein
MSEAERMSVDGAETMTLGSLIRHRYQTGEFGDCHLRMSQATSDGLRRGYPVPPHLTDLACRVVMELMGFRVVVDATVPEGEWRLVANRHPQPVRLAGRV